MSALVLRKLQQARQQLQSGEISAAVILCEDIVRRAPRNPDALWLLGTALLMLDRAVDAVPLFERAIAAAPHHGGALEHLGLAYLMLGEYVEAERVLRKAVSLPGAPYSVSMRLGLALFHQGKHGEAVVELQRAVQLSPEDVDAHLNLGRAYGAQHEWLLAQRQFEIVLSRSPQHADALYNMGVVSAEQGEPSGARGWFEKCLTIAPEHVEARERLGASCLALGRFPEAAAHLKRVVEIQPSNAGALGAFAEASFQCGSLDEAALAAEKASELEPAQPGPYALLAQIHHIQGELDRAVAILERGLRHTDADSLRGALVHLLHRQCDWQKWAPAWRLMQARLEHSSNLGSPFWLLCEATTPEQQLVYTRAWAAKNYPSPPLALSSKRSRTGKRLRIGYFSGDFHQHPVPALIAEVLELHDRSRFEIFAYSYGPDDKSPMRARLEKAVEHFVDIAWQPDDVAAQRIRNDDLDVLVDLKGYTAGDRLRVMAARPCAVQVAWLGYPGTTGAAFIDYLIADPFIIPADAEQHYSERVLRLPHCYQPNDRKRTASVARPREAYGLPDDAFVFCCFGQANKITPEIFDTWLRLLGSISNSVLWLLEDNRWATQNLIAGAVAAGIDSKRVIVAPRLPPADHLARYRAADVALDTFPYTSHTTGSDALWSGCPLIALSGNTFTARVSGSLLVNCGMQDLITYSIPEYEQLALRFATDEEYLRQIRARLDAARDSAPLFDSTRFTRDVERLYCELVSQ